MCKISRIRGQFNFHRISHKYWNDNIQKSAGKAGRSEIHCPADERIFKMSFHDRLNVSFRNLSESSLVHQILVNLDEDSEVTLYHESYWESFSNFDHGISLIKNADLKQLSF
jgi:hypothetical protein